ncbi:MAG: ADP-ribosylglycohydrolase family protein, partial [Clostridia bacterium]|nr:ADP-ribosylglycohydrolase family protein [Clostridia bacterium]
KESELYQELCWALDVCASGDLTSYAKARGHLDNHFKRMNKVHTIINMCAIVFGLALGEGDYTKAIGNTVAIGYDNDCTGATVGSIMGAMLGFDKIPEQWYKNFNDRIDTYIIGEGTQSIEDCVDRFVALNKQ